MLATEGSKTRGTDDLTHKLQDICKRAIDIRQLLGAETWHSATLRPEGNADLMECIARLQYEVYTIVNNAVRGCRPSVQRSGMPTKSYMGRLKGKEGRIRANLMGKRVDHCARSVIGPGPTLDIDEVGVPLRIALGVTVPEVVTAFNLAALSARVQRGSGRLDGRRPSSPTAPSSSCRTAPPSGRLCCNRAGRSSARCRMGTSSRSTASPASTRWASWATASSSCEETACA